MNPEEPVTISLPISPEIQVRGAEFAFELLGEGLSSKHPLRTLLAEAQRQLGQSALRRGYSRELSRVARWGLQLNAVRSWGHLDELLQRVKQDRASWDAHLHEAYVGFLFRLAGCQGTFVSQEGTPVPDLRVTKDSQSATVECKRSETLTAQERRNREIWYPITGDILEQLHSELPAAMIRFYPQQDAAPQDRATLLAHTTDLVSEYKQRHAPDDWAKRTLSEDGAFRCVFVASQDPDKVFDELAKEHPGIEVPSNIEPFSLRVQLTLSLPPSCDGIWWTKIHERRSWSAVEKAVLSRVDDKGSQLSGFRRSGHEDAKLPSIIWIDHPALRDADQKSLTGLLERLAGKLGANAGGHFDGVAGVVLSDARQLLDKTGQLHEQYRFSFATNANQPLAAESGFPFLSGEWVERAKSNLLPRVSVLGLEMGFGLSPPPR